MERLLALINANPGITLSRMATLLGLSWNATLHHVRRLERAGQVLTEHAGKVRYYPASGGSIQHQRPSAALQDPIDTRILRTAWEQAGVTIGGLAKAVGLHPSPVARRTARLERLGYLHRLDEGDHLGVYPSQALAGSFGMIEQQRLWGAALA